METVEFKFKNEILKSIDNIYTKSAGSKLLSEIFIELQHDIEKVSTYIHVTHREAFVISIIFSLNYAGDTVDIADLVKFFDCSPIKLLDFTKELDELVNNGYLTKTISHHRGDLQRSNFQYTINEIVPEKIIAGEKFPVNKQLNKTDSFIDLCEMIHTSLEESKTKFFGILLVERLVYKHKFIKPLDLFFKQGMSVYDISILLYVMWETVDGYAKVELKRLVQYVYSKVKERVAVSNDFVEGKHSLITLGYIEADSDKFVEDARLELTSKSLKLLEKAGIKPIALQKTKKDNIKQSDEIAKVRLFYNSEDEKQISMLAGLLKVSKFKQIQERLASKGLPQGVVALLYGEPGTGKTETVYQIARATNREVFVVDISQTKSKWFGDSEKVVKQIFNDYRKYSAECKKTPILLFNEADAVLSKRKDTLSSNVAQTENAIQNIILQELEVFDGIFMATTNLVGNFDTAFERRFLFKVELHKPSADVKGKIWKSKLKGLTAKQYAELSVRFPFSGGQINNIIKKCNIDYVLHGAYPSFEKILEYCHNESFKLHSGKSIGFGK